MTFRYLALGDSYTIGEGVAPEERWPARVVALLRERGVAIDDPEIVATTGWTTDELAAGIAAAAPRGPYDVVSLLIGVNNQYRGRAVEEYHEQFAALLAQAVDFAGGDARRVVVLSIPDWGVTPFAADRDRQQVAREIDAFNAVNYGEASRVGARYVDVTGITRDLGSGPETVVADGVHPSAPTYDAWARAAAPVFAEVLQG